MKSLFIALQQLKQASGISKKIIYQNEALCQNGVDSKLAYIGYQDGMFSLMIDGKKMVKVRYLKEVAYSYKIYARLEQYILTNKIDFIYIRYIHTANPFFYKFLKNTKSIGCRIFLEIPSYPYDGEYKDIPLTTKIRMQIERFYRQKFHEYVDRIVTFSADEYIFNCKTIRISNGVNLEGTATKRQISHKTFNMIGVANLMPWHGYDRIILGLYDYYQDSSPGKVDIVFNIVSPNCAICEELKRLVKKCKLENHVVFRGGKDGKELDSLFDISDLAISGLAYHRINNTSVMPIKNAEYAARGLPFITATNDSRFSNKAYMLNVKSDESPIDINSILGFYNKLDCTPEEIRNSVLDLSWKEQMSYIIRHITTNTHTNNV